VIGPTPLKASMLLPTPSEPLTAPTVITPGVNACGETKPPGVDTERAVRPSPPTQNFRNLPASEVSGVAILTMLVPG